MAEETVTVLQVALDVMHKKRALDIAAEAVAGGADWLEAGTPLIKSEGMDVVRELKAAFPGKRIVADMKVMDTGGFETEIAVRSGADIVVVMGVADDGTIREAVRSGQQYGGEIMVDLLGCPDPVKRAREVEAMGVSYVSVHTSIDTQMEGGGGFELVTQVASAVSIPVGAAGGINSETAAAAIKAGARVLAVGGAVHKAQDIPQAVRNIKEAMAGEPVPTELFKKYSRDEVNEAFRKASTPNICDANHKKGAMVGIKPVSVPSKLMGPAFTVRTADGDWAKPVEAIDKAQPGDVLVVDSGSRYTAIWGELASESCMKRGIAGIIVDGAIRDVDSIRELGFHAFARHTAPNAGEPKGFGELGVEIQCGGQTVNPGDYIVADENGIVVIPKDRITEVANRSLDVFERENRFREEIRAGSTLGTILELEKWEKK